MMSDDDILHIEEHREIRGKYLFLVFSLSATYFFRAYLSRIVKHRSLLMHWRIFAIIIYLNEKNSNFRMNLFVYNFHLLPVSTGILK